jgi:hypothetical protein
MQQAPRRGANPSTASPTGTNAEPQDAIALLKADHRQVEELFEAFASSDSDEEKAGLAESICDALTIHAQIEEELFYPAFLEATGDEDLYHEAAIEHEVTRSQIEQIQQTGPEDAYFDARLKVLSETIKHHVNEEEQGNGMFEKAEESDMDLDALGGQMLARKMALEEERLSEAN